MKRFDMKKIAMVALSAAMTVAAYAKSQTATLVANRLGKSDPVVPGVWHSNYSACKKYADENKVPLIAVWSNGDACSHCIRFESACNSSVFKNWMAKSGCVFYFTYPKDGGDGKENSTVFHKIRGNNTSYPFVWIYWNAGKVNVHTVGDTVDGNKSGSDGGTAAVNYIKNKIKGFAPVDPNLPYSVAFDPNYPTTAGQTGEMEPVDATYGTKFNLPANAFSCSNFVFSGWARSTTGKVAYKNGVAVQGLSAKSNSVVKLYARWTRTVYGPYYTGVKKTIKVSNYAGTLYASYKPASKIAGLTWNTKGYWTGTPTKAGTYKVTFKKGTSSFTRTFVIVKDEINVGGLEIAADGSVETDTSTRFDAAISAASGSLTSIKVTGLPEGIVYRDGVITGRAVTPGTYTVTISGVSKNSQTVKRTITLNVAEGDAILLNGLAHADELWVEAGDYVELPVFLKIKCGEDLFDVRALLDGDLAVFDGEGNPVVSMSLQNGKLWGAVETSGVYSLTISAEVDGRELTQELSLNVLERADN